MCVRKCVSKSLERKSLLEGILNRARFRFRGETGSALVEFSLILPVFLLLATGMTTFGIALNQYLELTNAVAVGAQQLAISRNAVADPCSMAVSAIQTAAPFLASSSIQYQIAFTAPTSSTTITSATYSSGKKGSPTCSGAAQSNMGQGGSVQVMATYPCTLSVYGANLIPGCTLHAEVTEIIE